MVLCGLTADFDARNGFADDLLFGFVTRRKNVEPGERNGAQRANYEDKPEEAWHFLFPLRAILLDLTWRDYDSSWAFAPKSILLLCCAGPNCPGKRLICGTFRFVARACEVVADAALRQHGSKQAEARVFSMTETDPVEVIKAQLGRRNIVLVGLMGCGKSSVGKRLAAKLGMPFIDADEEIEKVAAKTISEIFADQGEDFFRDRERKVIGRLLSSGPQILATGGGAYMHEGTRQAIRDMGISVWLRAELTVLMRRVGKRDTRPLLKTGNPEATMRKLMDTRYPVYAEADITVESRDEPHEIIVTEIVNRLAEVVKCPVRALSQASTIQMQSIKNRPQP